MNCTICKGAIAWPDIQGRTHFVCDGRVPTAKPVTPYGQAMQISQAVADAKWTPAQQRQVDAAIDACAREIGYFTADDVWSAQCSCATPHHREHRRRTPRQPWRPA
jgi:hypothetical protein